MKCKWYISIVLILFLLLVEVEPKRLTKLRHRKQKQMTAASPAPFPKSKAVTIPLVIHYDKLISDLLSKKYGSKSKTKIKILTKKFVKEAEEKFRHPSLKRKIILNLIDIKFLRNISNVLKIDDYSVNYLKNYCEWQAMKKKSSNKIFYSILITGVDLYYFNENGKKNRKRIGISYNNGVCNFDKSCAVIEWNDNLGRLMAHELAHSLGIKHDGPPNNHCVSRGLMMSSVYSAHTHTKGWSHCNNHDLDAFLRSEKAWCLK